MAAVGKLRPHDLVWKEGMKQWLPASNIKGLFPTAGADHRSESLVESGATGTAGSTTPPSRRKTRVIFLSLAGVLLGAIFIGALALARPRDNEQGPANPIVEKVPVDEEARPAKAKEHKGVRHDGIYAPIADTAKWPFSAVFYDDGDVVLVAAKSRPVEVVRIANGFHRGDGIPAGNVWQGTYTCEGQSVQITCENTDSGSSMEFSSTVEGGDIHYEFQVNKIWGDKGDLRFVPFLGDKPVVGAKQDQPEKRIQRNSPFPPTIDAFRKAAQAESTWSPKQAFYNRFGKPSQITSIGDRTYLDYSCKDGTARVECPTGPFEYQDMICPVSISQSR